MLKYGYTILHVLAFNTECS